MIDDDHDLREAITSMLESEGYEVNASPRITSFIRNLIHQEKPKAVILDVLLSGQNGIDICKSLKSDNDTKDIPVIMMSAHPSVKNEALEAGAQDFVSKPFDILEFLNKLRFQVAI